MFSTFLQKARVVHGDRYAYRATGYSGAFQRMQIRCPVHGVFKQTPRDHLTGCGCPVCGEQSKREKLTNSADTSIRKLKALYPNLDFTASVYGGFHKPVAFICPLHGEKAQYFSVLVRRDRAGTAGCQDCNRSRPRVSEETIRTRLVVKRPEFKFDLSAYSGVMGTVKVRCPDGHDWQAAPNNLLSKSSGCPICSANAVSSSEHLLYEWLVSEGIAVERRVRSVLARNRELDLYLPEHRLAIEINGAIWHSEAYGKDRSYHYEKTLECKQQGIRLLHFWDTEVKDSLDLVKSMIRQRLGLNRRVFARKLNVVKISNAEARDFLLNNHLQGSAACALAYGLRTRKGRLAAVMTFGKPYINQSFSWEIKRFACHQGITVVGGASKLFSAFRKEHTPSAVITYADLRYATGEVYRKMGFALAGRSRPSYFWSKGGTSCLTRYQTQKAKLHLVLGSKFNPKLSERENMEASGFSRVFDCGNLIFTFTEQHP